jgi:hypothetical protein
MNTATLVSGYNDWTTSDIVGLSIASIRSRYGATFNIPEGARATVNGVQVAEDAVLQAGQELVFDAPTGAKG